MVLEDRSRFWKTEKMPPPRAIPCPLCGQGFFKASLPIHLKSCEIKTSNLLGSPVCPHTSLSRVVTSCCLSLPLLLRCVWLTHTHSSYPRACTPTTNTSSAVPILSIRNQEQRAAPAHEHLQKGAARIATTRCSCLRLQAAQRPISCGRTGENGRVADEENGEHEH